MFRLVKFSLIALFVLSGFSQVRENPRKPLHPDPGRVLKLIEVMKINGEGQGYYFEGVKDLGIDRVGNLYFCDSWSTARPSHLIKFSAEGKFIRDLLRRGEGPGEVVSAFDFAMSDSELFLYDLMKRKIVVMDTDGNFRAEFKKETAPFDDFIGLWRDWLVFLRVDYPLERKTSRLYNVKNAIILVSQDGKTEKELGAFPNQMFFISSAQGGGGMDWDPFHAVIGGDQIFVCTTQDYQIQVLDLTTARVTLSFKRDYPRVGHVAQDWEKKFISQYSAPKRDREDDLEDLSFGGGLLWVRTSTESKEKGVLYDLFDISGRFVDSFFINLSGRIVKIDGDSLYASTYDESDLPLLVKSKIAEPIGAR